MAKQRRCQCGAVETIAPLSKCYRCNCGDIIHTQYDALAHHEHERETTGDQDASNNDTITDNLRSTTAGNP